MTTNIHDVENAAIARAVQADPRIKLLARQLQKLVVPHPQEEPPIIFVKQAYSLAKNPVDRKVFLEIMELVKD